MIIMMSRMKPSTRAMIAMALLAACASPVMAQQPASTTTQKSLSATLNVYVFPTAGQAPDQQSKDEGECYNWAVTNSGVDPFNLAKQADAQKAQAEQASKQAQQATKGAGAKGAVGGAAAGALIGEIASDDAGTGAAYGAAAGAIAGRRRAKSAEQKAQADIQKQSQQAAQFTAEQMGNFKKAFSVCLEAKKYMVKY